MRNFLVAAGVAALAAGTLAAPAPAAADGDGIVCQGGNVRLKFVPNVTFRRQGVLVQAEGDLGTCTSAAVPAITGGTLRFTGSGTGLCPGPYALGYGHLQIFWNDNSVSDLPNTSVRADALSWNLDAVAVGTGTFPGLAAHLSGRPTLSPGDLGAQCYTGGVPGYPATVDATALA